MKQLRQRSTATHPLKRREKRLKPQNRSSINKSDDYINIEIGLANFNRYNKDKVYKIARNVLYKSGIKGNYIGLGGFYIREIAEALGPQVKKITNCENKEKYIADLEDYYAEQCFESNKHSLYIGDIFDRIQNSEEKFSVIDLDLTWCLNKEKLAKILCGIEKAAANKCLVALWSCYGRAITEKKYDEEIRPLLLRRLRENFKIIEHKAFKYRDNVIPIKVELVALKRKK